MLSNVSMDTSWDLPQFDISMPFTNQTMDITTPSSDPKVPSAGLFRKKKKPRISPLLLAFDRQSSEAKALRDRKESSHERMKMRSKRILELTKLKSVGLLGECSKKGRPREIPKDEHGNYKATVFGSTVYAGVAHVLINEIITKKEDGRIVSAIMVLALKNSIWELVHIDRENCLRKRAIVISNEAHNGKRTRVESYKVWAPEVKRLAVDHLYDALPNKKCRDDTWRFYVSDIVRELRLQYTCFKDLTGSHLITWYENFESDTSRNGWDLNRECLSLADNRTVTNKNARLVPPEVRTALKAYITSMIAQQLQINCTLIRPFLKRYLDRKFPVQSEQLFNPPHNRRKFQMSYSWIRFLLKDCNMAY
jgi:hypothetical protein